MKENIPRYESPDHMTKTAIDEVYKLLGFPVSFTDDRYTRGRRSLSYGNPAAACKGQGSENFDFRDQIWSSLIKIKIYYFVEHEMFSIYFDFTLEKVYRKSSNYFYDY